MSMEIELPIIDVGELLKSPEDAIETVKEIGTACRDHGFFYIKNHGVDTEQQLQLTRQFFNLPQAVKDEMHIKRSKNAFRGYYGPSQTKLDVSSNSPGKEWKEGAVFRQEFPNDHPGILASKAFHGPNQYPPEKALPGFREGIQRNFEQLNGLGFVLMSAMARSLGLDKDFFKEQFHSEAFSTHMLLHYPPPGEDTSGNIWGAGQHTDYGVLTILLQDDVGGLQVQTKAGKWIDVPPVDGTFVINLGDVLEVWADGAFTARPHRVEAPKDRDRYSAAFFFNPNLKTIVSKISHEKAMIDIDPSLIKSQIKLEMDLPFEFGDYYTYKSCMTHLY